MSEFSDFEDEEGVEEPVLSEPEEAESAGEEEVVVFENPLLADMMADCLSLLCKTGNGLALAFVRLDTSQKSITDISILKHFSHLRYVDISINKICDISPLNHLLHLITLKADINLLPSAKMNQLPYLQHADFSNNRIQTLEGITHPLLEKLNVNGNEISHFKGLDSSKLSRLTQLELRGNKLAALEGLYLAGLRKLFAGENEIRSLQGVSKLQFLTTLHLRKNRLQKLDGFSDFMKQLQYLNLRGNEISDFNEITKLKCLPMLRAIILRENPISFEEAYRIEIIVILRKLIRLDQEVYEDDERQEAEEIYNQRNVEEEDVGGDNAIEVINSEDDQNDE